MAIFCGVVIITLLIQPVIIRVFLHSILTLITMKRSPLFYLISTALIACGVSPHATAQDAISSDTHLYAGFGNFKRPISTVSEEAQEWFNQGMQLVYGFNHDEGIRSFHAAAVKDTEAPMPWWGIAYAHGVNINDMQMDDVRNRLAREAADNALERIDQASPVEAALIHAVSARYEYPTPEDRSSLDLAYSDAMANVYSEFGDDPDVGALYAESLMDLQPWNYWDNEGNPIQNIEEVVAVLEKVLSLYPQHPGANHFYIHAVEASQNPDRAVSAADRLTSLVPGAGHLVHMPSHIYIRVGRYSDAVDSNSSAVSADRTYLSRAPDPSIYAIYYAHNLHFLSYAAMMSGRYADALQSARDLEAEMPKGPLEAFAGLIDGIMPTSFHVMIRFGKWEAVLAEPDYEEDYRLVSRAVRRYARSIAYSALGKTEEAHAELIAFNEAMAAVPEEWYVFNNQVSKVLPIAQAMVKGELLYREGKIEESFTVLREGIKAEDVLVYDEPPGWMLPVRHAFGALLMAEERYVEAEAVYREDLRRNRKNGWALVGLQNSLNGQEKYKEADALTESLVRAWAKADTIPSSSCFCEPGKQLASK